MPLVLKDRVKVATTSTGTGTITLGATAAGFQSFATIGDGNTTYYTIVDQTNNAWEVGIGTYTTAGPSLSRDVVLESSNSGSLVNFAAGSKDVFVVYPAERAIIGGMGYVENAATVTQSSTINSGNNAMSAGPVTLASGVTVTVPSGSVWTVI